MARLLESGYDLQSCLDVIRTKKNQQRIERLCLALLEGRPLVDHLVDIKGLQVHFAFFYEYTSLAVALHQSIGMYVYEEQLKKKLINTCWYPSLVMIISIAGFFFMTLFVLPMLMELLLAMDIAMHPGILMLMHGLSVLLVVLIVLLLVCSIAMFFAFHHRQEALMFFLNRYFDSHPLLFFHSYLWAGYWLEFQRHLPSTHDAISYLKQMEHRMLTKTCANRIHEALLQGVDLIDAMKQSEMLHETLCFYFDMGTKCQQVSLYLQSYLDESKEAIALASKKLVYGLQCASYVCVGVIVIAMVQLLFAPLDLLSQL